MDEINKKDRKLMHGRCCPACKREVEDQTLIAKEDKQPKEGDFCVCGYCGFLSRFDANGMFVTVKYQDLQQFKIDQPDQWKKLKLVQQFIKSDKNPLHKRTK